MSKKLKDRLWLWGQNAGSHHASAGNKGWKLPGINRMSPVEGANYLGIPNICRVVMGGQPEPPFDGESDALRGMNQVVWSAIGDSGSTRNNGQSDLEEVLRQAGMHQNITGVILDDFFKSKRSSDDSHGRYSVEKIAAMRKELCEKAPRPLDFWIVWYKRELGFDIDDYLSLFDVITYWNMKAPAESAQLEDDIATVVRKTPGKRRLAGCYLWNYGEGKPLSLEEIQRECETYRDWVRRDLIEGIIFCSNCCADLGLDAVEWVRDWIRKEGDEVIH